MRVHLLRVYCGKITKGASWPPGVYEVSEGDAKLMLEKGSEFCVAVDKDAPILEDGKRSYVCCGRDWQNQGKLNFHRRRRSCPYHKNR